MHLLVHYFAHFSVLASLLFRVTIYVSDESMKVQAVVKSQCDMEKEEIDINCTDAVIIESVTKQENETIELVDEVIDFPETKHNINIQSTESQIGKEKEFVDVIANDDEVSFAQESVSGDQLCHSVDTEKFPEAKHDINIQCTELQIGIEKECVDVIAKDDELSFAQESVSGDQLCPSVDSESDSFKKPRSYDICEYAKHSFIDEDNDMNLSFNDESETQSIKVDNNSELGSTKSMIDTYLEDSRWNDEIDSVQIGAPDLSRLDWISKLVIYLASEKKSVAESALSELASIGCIEDSTDHEEELRTMHIIASAYDTGAHAAIVGAMNRWYDTMEIQLLGCRTLHNFGISKEFRQGAGRIGAFETLLQAMVNFPEEAELMKLACACLCCLCASDEMAKYLVFELDGLKPIMNTMKEYSTDGFVQLWCCSAINFMSNFPELRKPLDDVDTVKVLFTVIQHFNDIEDMDHCVIQNQARDAIKNLL